MDELKKCPFCGFKAKMFREGWEVTYTTSWWVECTNQSCVIPEMSTQEYDTEKQAIKAWNTRSK